MSHILSVSIARFTASALHTDEGRPWYTNVLASSILAGLTVGGSAFLGIAAMSLLPGWDAVSLAAMPTFCIASLLCATVIAVKTWSR